MSFPPWQQFENTGLISELPTFRSAKNRNAVHFCTLHPYYQCLHTQENRQLERFCAELSWLHYQLPGEGELAEDFPALVLPSCSLDLLSGDVLFALECEEHELLASLAHSALYDARSVLQSAFASFEEGCLNTLQSEIAVKWACRKL